MKHIKFLEHELKHKNELTSSRPNKVPKTEVIVNYDLDDVIVKQVFANLILLKQNCKSPIKVVDLNSKS